MAIKRGNAKRNTLVGTNGKDSLFGLGGDDKLIGKGGNDKLFGGTGNDKLFGGAGKDTLDGGKGGDTLDGGTGNDIMKGGLGDDTYIVDSAGDVVIDSSGTDIVLAAITYTLGADIENLTLNGAGAINGTGNAGANVITGNTGANVLDGGAGADTLNGGGGSDTITYAAATSVVIATLDAFGNGVVTVAGFGTDTYTSIENITGGSDNDILIGNNLDNVLIGNDGFDTLRGGGGADTIFGGRFGDDIEGGAGADKLDGGDQLDTLNYFNSVAGVTVNLGANTASGGDAQGDTIVNFEDLVGSNTGGDSLTGSDGANDISGGGGNDTINGGDGNDFIAGGTGNDTLIVGLSASFVNSFTATLLGNDDFDTLSFELGNKGLFGGSTLSFTLDQSGGATESGFATYGLVDSVTYSSIENITGRNRSDFGDNLTGNDGNNVINGLAGNDTLDGGKGGDTLFGGDGNDTLIGGIGQDNLDGGAGDDILQPGGDGTKDSVDGSDGIDWGSYADSSVGVIAALSVGFAGSDDSFLRVENLLGSSFIDTLTGDGNANVLDGSKSVDSVTGGGGADLFQIHSLTGFNYDVIQDYTQGSDKFRISSTEFGINSITGATLVNTNTLPLNGTGAVPQFIYYQNIFDGPDSVLYYDSNGAGAGGLDAVAIIINGATIATSLSASDFDII